MKLMVLGFLFDRTGDKVLLIEKLSGPPYVVGKWNGIGGKVEPNESTIDAMRRECLEETALPIMDWKEFGSLDGPDWAVLMYRANHRTNQPFLQREVERLEWFWVKDVLEGKVKIPYNLNWLIPLALDPDRLNVGVIYHD